MRTSGYANEYEFDETNLTVVDLNGVDYCALHWLALLLENRTFDIRAPLALEARDYLTSVFRVDTSKADVIKGYRADDSYFTFAQDFLRGSISYRQLNNALCMGKLGRQIMLKSPLAFERLSFVGAHAALLDVWLPRREERDRLARKSYFDVECHRRRAGDIYITHILDEGMEPDDARL